MLTCWVAELVDLPTDGWTMGIPCNLVLLVIDSSVRTSLVCCSAFVLSTRKGLHFLGGCLAGVLAGALAGLQAGWLAGLQAGSTDR